jgi:hypothetical protein
MVAIKIVREWRAENATCSHSQSSSIAATMSAPYHALLTRKLEYLDDALDRCSESQRHLLLPIRDSFGRIRDATAPGALSPSPEQAEQLLIDATRVQTILRVRAKQI